MPRAPEVTDPLFIAYGEACAWASILELKMRLLADKTPALQHLAHAQALQDIETAIVASFGGSLQPGEAELLERSRFLRNKVVHGNFSEAKEVLLKLGIQVPSGGVLEVSLKGVPVLDAITAGLRQPVSATPTKKSRIFGWLLECGVAGLFPKASEVFRRATDLVERLARSD